MIAVVPLAGSLVDRRGPRGVVLAGTVCTVAGALGPGLSAWPAPALAGSFLIGAGSALTTPATRAVLLNAVPSRQRTQAATASFMMWNLGLGGGSLAGGLLASPRHAASFTVLFGLMAALSVLTRLVNLPAMPRRTPRHAARPRGPAARAAVTPVFACYLMLAAALQFAGYGQTTSGLPGLAATLLGVPPRTVGVALAVNTGVILLTSPLTRRISGRASHSRTLGLVAGLWAGCWGLVMLGAAVHRPGSAATAVIAFYAVFGIGEVLLAAASSPLVAELAPDGALGRYLGMDTLTRQLGGALGPAMSGMLIADHATLSYPAICAGTCLLAVPIAWRLGRLLAAHPGTASPPGETKDFRNSASPGR
jgi:MFS family permease